MALNAMFKGYSVTWAASFYLYIIKKNTKVHVARNFRTIVVGKVFFKRYLATSRLTILS